MTGQEFFVKLFMQGMPRGTSTERRLAKYARYRASEKGRDRTCRYNGTEARKETSRRYRLCHVRGLESYQPYPRTHWVKLMKVDPADRALAMAMARDEGWLMRDAGLVTSQQRVLLKWGMNHQLLTGPPNAGPQPDTEAVWNQTHSRFARAKKGTWQWRRTQKNPDGNSI